MGERQALTVLDLPVEVRISIFEYVFEANVNGDGFIKKREGCGGIMVDNSYTAATNMAPLLACRQFYHDANDIALARTPFVVRDTFTEICQRLATLHPKQVQSIRSITFLAGLRQFQNMQKWGTHPFGMTSLRLETLTIAFHRSSYWHYPSDHNHEIVKLLRNLEGVQKIVFVRNGANIKGQFRTWYNRLIGLIMKEDHHRRYDCRPPVMEKTWWSWSFDENNESFCLEAQVAKPVMEEGGYIKMMAPLVHELMERMDDEEWDPDPRARLPF